MEKKKPNENKIGLEEQIKSLVALFLNTINPIHKSAPTAEKLIRSITIFFAAIAILGWYDRFGLIRFIFKENSGRWDLSVVESFLPLILLSIAVVLFGLRKKNGWTLMTAYLTYSAISAFILIIITWNMRPFEVNGFGDLFNLSSPPNQVLKTIIYIGILWVLTKKEVKKKYEVKKPKIIKTIGITSLLTILFTTLLLLI